MLALMATGRDPVLERQRARVAGVTLDEVLQQYVSMRTLRPNTRQQFLSMVPRCLGDWMDLPVTGITKNMIEQRHRDLRRVTRQGSSGEAQANAVMRILGVLLNFAAANYELDGEPILTFNPVKKLSQNHAWYREYRRQVIIPDHQLAPWYREVAALRRSQVRDYLLLLLFTGLRRMEAATLTWKDIDFETQVLRVSPEVTKSKREHRLPLSDFLLELLSQRHKDSGAHHYVFPGQGGRGHMVDSGYVIDQVIKRSGVQFNLHDLRRTYLTTAEKLGLPYVVLKKLANHSGGADTTFGYLIVDVERLREPVQVITNRLKSLCLGS